MLDLCRPLFSVSGSFDRVRAGDCIVCFGKNDIYHVSRQLERRGVEVAVIYGTLPPGEQALVVHRFWFYSGHRCRHYRVQAGNHVFRPLSRFSVKMSILFCTFRLDLAIFVLLSYPSGI